MAKCACRFLLPVNYNDGSPVEPEIFIEIKMALDRQFGGFRIVAPSEGSWHGQVEATHEIEVSVEPEEVPALRRLVIEIGRRLGQKAMYFDAPPPTVEIIDIDPIERLDIDRPANDSGNRDDDSDSGRGKKGNAT